MTTADSTSLRALAALVRTGLTVRQALAAWPEEIPADRRADPARVAQRVTLGRSVSEAVRGLPTGLAHVLRPLLALHLVAGGDVAAALDKAAEAIEEEAGFLQDAKAASSGARLSGRLVAGLPLAFVPFSPAVRSFGDPAGFLMLSLGVVLALMGLRWLGRLVPAPPLADPSIQLCCALAALLRGGLSLNQALATLAGHPPVGLEGDLSLAAAQVRLGRPWRTALASGGALGRVARVIARSERVGVPVADALERLAETLRAEQALAFETKMRRAPVLMVVPLTCCILPAYGLLAVGPFLRSVTLG